MIEEALRYPRLVHVAHAVFIIGKGIGRQKLRLAGSKANFRDFAPDFAHWFIHPPAACASCCVRA